MIISSRMSDIVINTERNNLPEGAVLRFSEYQSSKVIGQKIYDSFISLWYEKGISLDGTENGKYGLISNIMALSSMLEFHSMEVNITKDIDKFHFLLESIFTSVYKGTYPTFDASPYYENPTTGAKIKYYVESASKICITMIDLRNYAIINSIQKKPWLKDLTLNKRHIQSFDDLANAAEELLLDAIGVLTESCLPTREKERTHYTIGETKVQRNNIDSIMHYRGWSFQRPDGDADEYGTSIYYTYHATNAYISLYNAYPNILTSAFFDNIEFTDESLSSLSDDKREKYARDLAFIRRNKKIITLFRDMCSSSGRYIDTILKEKNIDLSFDYIKTGFSKVSADQILDSQKNNHIMDTLFTIAILMNAGIDEDYEFVGQRDYIYNQILYSLTNIKKIYNILRRNQKEDLVDSYMLSSALFSERFPMRHNALMREFRTSCEGVIVYDLVPLLCNTYALIFSYLIKYPQKDMVDNLELIMENRAHGDCWYWDKDSFSINNNLYYIVALENFYDYYKEYELPFMGLEEQYNEVANKALVALKDKTKDHNAALKKITELKALYEHKKSVLDAEVERISQKIFDEQFEKAIVTYLEKMIDDSIKFNIEYFADGENLETLLAMYPAAELLLKLISAEKIADRLVDDGSSGEQELLKTKANISKKIRNDLESKKGYHNPD